MQSIDFSTLQALSKRFDQAFPEASRWLDDTRFVAFARPSSGAEDTPRQLFVIDAETGSERRLFDGDALRTAFEAVEGVSEEAAGKIARRKQFTLLAGHEGAVVPHEGVLYHYRFGAREAQRLSGAGKAEGPKLSPDGTHVAYVLEHDLHVTPATGGTEKRLTHDGAEERLNGRLDWVYQEEIYGRGTWGGFWWSPDSDRIAFLQLDESPVASYPVFDHVPVLGREETWRYPKAGEPNPRARLGFVPAGGGDVVWADLDDAYAPDDRLLVRVDWTPDGEAVLLQLTDRIQSRLDLLLVDPFTGAVTPVLTEEGQPWVRHVKVKWVDDHRFLWTSTRDGWNHLYLHHRDGTLERRLTEGPFEVIELLGTANGSAFAITNEKGIIERHLWRIPLDGSERVRITRDAGCHGATCSPGLVHALVRSHSSAHPGRLEVVRLSDGEVVRTVAAIETGALDAVEYVVPEFVQIDNGNGFILEASITRPPDFDRTRRYPVLVHVYGGPHAPLVRDQWVGIFALWRSELARRGIVVFNLDPQAASGKGDEAAYVMHRRAGETELHDLHAGLDWLGDQGIADRERIAIFGWSYGGFMASYALTHSDRFKLGIAGAPVTDWHNYDTIYTEQYMGTPQDNADGYAASNVVAAAEHLSGELLLIHGTLDENVHVSNSLQFAQALQKAGKQFRFMLYPSNRHGVTDTAQQAHLYTMMTDFLTSRL